MTRQKKEHFVDITDKRKGVCLLSYTRGHTLEDPLLCQPKDTLSNHVVSGFTEGNLIKG